MSRPSLRKPWEILSSRSRYWHCNSQLLLTSCASMFPLMPSSTSVLSSRPSPEWSSRFPKPAGLFPKLAGLSPSLIALKAHISSSFCWELTCSATGPCIQNVDAFDHLFTRLLGPHCDLVQLTGTSLFPPQVMYTCKFKRNLSAAMAIKTVTEYTHVKVDSLQPHAPIIA